MLHPSRPGLVFLIFKAKQKLQKTIIFFFLLNKECVYVCVCLSELTKLKLSLHPVKVLHRTTATLLKFMACWVLQTNKWKTIDIHKLKLLLFKHTGSDSFNHPTFLSISQGTCRRISFTISCAPPASYICLPSSSPLSLSNASGKADAF